MIDSEQRRGEVLEEVRSKRGYVLSYHRLLAADDPQLLQVYDELYTRITLDERALSNTRKELVWLGLLSAREEPTGRIHVERAQQAGLSSGQMADALALAAAARTYYAVVFTRNHWGFGIKAEDAEARYITTMESARGHMDPATAELVAVIVQGGLRNFDAMTLHLRRAFAAGVSGEEMREAYSFLLLPCGGNLFIHAVDTWQALAETESVPSPFGEAA